MATEKGVAILMIQALFREETACGRKRNEHRLIINHAFALPLSNRCVDTPSAYIIEIKQQASSRSAQSQDALVLGLETLTFRFRHE